MAVTDVTNKIEMRAKRIFVLYCEAVRGGQKCGTGLVALRPQDGNVVLNPRGKNLRISTENNKTSVSGECPVCQAPYTLPEIEKYLT